MKNIEKIRANEKLYKKLLNDRLKADKRLSLACPDFKYPEPLYFYVKSVKTEKTIAIRIDGGDDTVRFWDYVDDGYESDDGVWEKIEDGNIEAFVDKLYSVMDRAVDIEFYDKQGITDDYYAGVTDGQLDESAAKELLKKHGKGVKFLFAKISNFYGDRQYVFDSKLSSIKRV